METSELKYGRQAVASCWNYCIWKTIDSNRNTWTWFRCLCSQSPEESKLQLVILYPYRDGREEMTVQILTLFRLGFFGQSVTGRGGSSDPPSVSLEPIMLGSWNLHTMIISVQKSPTPNFDLPHPMMTSQWRHIPIFQCFLLFFHLDT